MTCYHPLQALYKLGSNGKKEITFLNKHPGQLVSDNHLQLPCGRCIGCRLDRAKEWSIRCMHEASLHEDSIFVTLTYRPDALPDGGTLVKRDLQLFFKRLRKHLGDVEIRYFACGEYGECGTRPHYHALIFGWIPLDRELYKAARDPLWHLYKSETLERIWGHGWAPFGSVTLNSAGYVARYCVKKVGGDMAADHYQGRIPEFSLMSLKPGIGQGWYDRWKIDLYPSDYCVYDGRRYKIPRYYDTLLEREDPVAMRRLKEERVAAAALRAADSTPDRLTVREIVAQARFKKLLRSMEAV